MVQGMGMGMDGYDGCERERERELLTGQWSPTMNGILCAELPKISSAFIATTTITTTTTTTLGEGGCGG